MGSADSCGLVCRWSVSSCERELHYKAQASGFSHMSSMHVSNVFSKVIMEEKGKGQRILVERERVDHTGSG